MPVAKKKNSTMSDDSALTADSGPTKKNSTDSGITKKNSTSGITEKNSTASGITKKHSTGSGLTKKNSTGSALTKQATVAGLPKNSAVDSGPTMNVPTEDQGIVEGWTEFWNRVLMEGETKSAEKEIDEGWIQDGIMTGCNKTESAAPKVEGLKELLAALRSRFKKTDSAPVANENKKKLVCSYCNMDLTTSTKHECLRSRRKIKSLIRRRMEQTKPGHPPPFCGWPGPRPGPDPDGSEDSPCPTITAASRSH